MSTTDTISAVPQRQADREAIAAQVEKIVSHASFRSSRRCSALLRYITEKQLQDQTLDMKERMIGINVFGRPLDYDASADPVVRTAASDLRRRLSQYYHEPGHENELRITVPPGAYRVEFHVPDCRDSSTFVAPICQPTAFAPTVQNFPRLEKSRLKRTSALVISGCLVLAAFLAIGWKRSTLAIQPVDEFWAALSGSRPLVCVGTWSLSSVTPEGSTKPETALDFHDLLPMTDAVAFSRVTAFLGQTGIPFQVETAKATTLGDLTQSPVILIGAVDNQWTMRVTDPLRFHFVRSAQSGGRVDWVIEDRKNPRHKFVSGSGDMTDSTTDYALVGRLFDNGSGQIAFLVAGMGAAGTTAASEFITTARYMDVLTKRIPNAAKAKNLEAIISVPVVDSKPGVPRLEAAEAW